MQQGSAHGAGGAAQLLGEVMSFGRGPPMKNRVMLDPMTIGTSRATTGRSMEFVANQPMFIQYASA